VRMPGMDGIEATRRITAELPGTITIGLSAHEGKNVGRCMVEAGAVAYVNKAGPPEDLHAAIRKYSLSKG
jgi:DNA-binding NarL/FixJ family response regulator